MSVVAEDKQLLILVDKVIIKFIVGTMLSLFYIQNMI